MKILGGIVKKFVKGTAPVKETSVVLDGVCTSGVIWYSFAVRAALCKLRSQAEHCLNLSAV